MLNSIIRISGISRLIIGRERGLSGWGRGMVGVEGVNFPLTYDE